ncbi:MAG: glycosyltransferase family 2 protein [Gemmataceae bacterium]
MRLSTVIEPGAVPPVRTWARRPSLVSIVVPVFREAEGIQHFGETLIGVLNDLGLPYELIFVEDDSPDGSLEQLRGLFSRYPSVVRILSLSRRFGHQASLAAGFDEARGDVVICMDSDMQHPPHLVPFLLWQWSCGFQLVYTRRRKQEGRGPLKEFASQCFYRAINYLSEVQLEDGTADFRLMDRLVVDALRRFEERWLFYRGLVQWAGFRRIAVWYDAPARFAGTSSYTWKRMFRMGADALFTFSLFPLRLSYALGATALILTFLYAVFTLFTWAVGAGETPGYTSLVLLVSGLSGLNLICLGIVGEYVGRIHEQVKHRPLYLVKERIGGESSTQSCTHAA